MQKALLNTDLTKHVQFLLNSMLSCWSATNQDFRFSCLPIHFFLSTKSMSSHTAMAKKGQKTTMGKKIWTEIYISSLVIDGRHKTSDSGPTILRKSKLFHNINDWFLTKSSHLICRGSGTSLYVTSNHKLYSVHNQTQQQLMFAC